jgi:hypothetical protein
MGLLALALVGLTLFLSEGITGKLHTRGTPGQAPLPPEHVTARERARTLATAELAAVSSRQILFGDLHVHTTFSADAFVFSLPLMQGEGAHPPADACDFARFCAELDFWSINDHAESITPRQWAETRESIRECNAVAGDSQNPDTVAFLGWEWTQSSPESFGGKHWGHKNILLAGIEDDDTPTRPIGAGAGGLFSQVEIPGFVWAVIRAGLTAGDFPHNLGPYLDFNQWTREVRGLEICPSDVPVRELPPDCLEGASEPAELFAKLDDWGYPALVIPHGTTWGIHAPPAADLGDQLEDGQHDPARQRLFEVYSGHGNNELWRDLRDTEIDAQGQVSCAPPRNGYEPCCWRAGEIIRARCEGLSEITCEERIQQARRWYLELPGTLAKEVVPGAVPNDWGECGQLAGTFLPAMEYRPQMSAQYGLARRPAGAAATEAGAFRFGLIGSSDNHKARAGAGYKEIGRKSFGDAYGLRDDWHNRLKPEPKAPSSRPVPPEEVRGSMPFADPGAERNASYYYTAGLVAVHADGRDRGAIFNALEARRTYGTSGPRILLHFDLENGPDGLTPMGSDVPLRETPRFTVRAVGDFRQLPGCPEVTQARLTPERLRDLCLDECYHPSDERHLIDRIEVVRIRPQQFPEEPLHELVEDPWRVFPCPPNEAGCVITFEDPEFQDKARETIYYVRALQEPTLAVNGDPMRCDRDADGNCLQGNLCPAAGPDADPDDPCLSMVRERAWSSPIFVRHAGTSPGED